MKNNNKNKKLFFYKKLLISTSFLFFVLFFTNNAFAITLDSKSYTLDESGSHPIIAIAPATNGLLVLYKFGTELPIASFDTYNEGDDLNYNRFTPGNYSFVELTAGVGDSWLCN